LPSAPSLATKGTETLLTDRQVIASPAGIERYWHIAYRVLDEGAVQDNSQIEIVFDSSYQRLVLHSVRILRGGHIINQLEKRRIRVAQRESRLEEKSYDGSLTVDVLLYAVRPGDARSPTLPR